MLLLAKAERLDSEKVFWESIWDQRTCMCNGGIYTERNMTNLCRVAGNCCSECNWHNIKRHVLLFSYSYIKSDESQYSLTVEWMNARLCLYSSCTLRFTVDWKIYLYLNGFFEGYCPSDSLDKFLAIFSDRSFLYMLHFIAYRLWNKTL